MLVVDGITDFTMDSGDVDDIVDKLGCSSQNFDMIWGYLVPWT